MTAQTEITAGGPLAEGDGVLIADIIAQLRAAEVFLATHELPVSSVTSSAAGLRIYKFCDSTAEVDQIAVGLGREASWRTPESGQYFVSLTIGELCRNYEAVYIVKDDQPPEDTASVDQATAEAGEPVAA